MNIINQLELLAIFCAVLTCGDLFCHGDMGWGMLARTYASREEDMSRHGDSWNEYRGMSGDLPRGLDCSFVLYIWNPIPKPRRQDTLDSTMHSLCSVGAKARKSTISWSPFQVW